MIVLDVCMVSSEEGLAEGREGGREAPTRVEYSRAQSFV